MDSTSEGEYTSGGEDEDEEPGLTLEQEEEEALKNSQNIEGSKVEVEETVEEAIGEEESSDAEERRANIQQWMEKLAKVKREEFEREEAALVPLRRYLMAHVVPTLTKGLIDVTRARPEDPVEYLAEFLFANNPGSLNTTLCEKFPKTEETKPKLEDLVNEQSYEKSEAPAN